MPTNKQKLNEGKEKSNEKKPSDQLRPSFPPPPPKVTTPKPITGEELILQQLILNNEKMDKLIHSINTTEEMCVTETNLGTNLSELSISDLKLLKDFANDIIVKNKYPGGDVILTKECHLIGLKIDEEMTKRLKNIIL